MKADDRVVAAAGMQRHEQVAVAPLIDLRDSDLMSQLLEYPGPTQRGHTVTVSRFGRRRSNDFYLHRTHWSDENASFERPRTDLR